MISSALAQIPVGVVVERHPARSPWLDFLWRPVAVLAGVPSAAPWTPLGTADGVVSFYAGPATIELHRTETANYRTNLASRPLLWVVLRPTGGQPAMDLLLVTADPAEGEALTGAGNDLVEAVPMPAAIAETLAAFVAAHHVDQPHIRRKRDRTGLPPARAGDDSETA